ncbi:MAG: imidazole glycerol phosphate synthase subunit HisH [Nannocystaceae bacterium]
MARELTLVDAGHGNLGGVERALLQVGASVQVSSDPDVVARSRMVVFAGQGAFAPAVARVVEGALGEALRMVIQRGDPFLGISLGMQLLFDGSQESDSVEGLHVLPGLCRRFPNDMTLREGDAERRLKVPHMGWNNVEPSGEHYYFVHSYYVEPAQASDVMWTAKYANIVFAAAVNRDNVYGCQFHPEKSQQAGLRFLRAFLLGGKAA